MVTAKKAMTNRTKSEFTSHCRIAATTNLFPARFAHTRYSSRMIGRFLNWGDHGKLKSTKGLRDVKEGGIIARKAGLLWGLGMKKATLQVRLNRRVTFDPSD